MLKSAMVAGVSSIAKGSFQRPLERGCTPLWELFQSGQMLELSGRAPGKLSAVVRLLVRAQAEGEPVAWITLRDGACFYPPDFAQAGIDLAALLVVRLGDDAGPHGVVRAAEMLLRSGAFGLVVIDFAAGIPKGELSWQARLSGLLRRHDARAVLITSSASEEPSLGPLVSLRVEASLREQAGRRVLLSQRLLKSKLGAAAVSPDVRGLPLGA